MEVEKTITSSVERWDGVEIVTLIAGQKLKISVTGGGGGQLLDITVPDGKVWSGSIRVQFYEIDA